MSKENRIKITIEFIEDGKTITREYFLDKGHLNNMRKGKLATIKFSHPDISETFIAESTY